MFEWNWTRNHNAIVSIRAINNSLTERQLLLDGEKFDLVTAWTLAGDQLVLSDEFRICSSTTLCEHSIGKNAPKNNQTPINDVSD